MDIITIICIAIIVAFIIAGIFTWIFSVPDYIRRIAIALEKLVEQKEKENV